MEKISILQCFCGNTQIVYFSGMKAATLNEIKQELTNLPSTRVLELCLRLGRFKKENKDTLLISIEDDGIGFNKAKEHAKAGHKSLGTKTIENILELNTKLTGKNQKVEIIDKSDLFPHEEGTRITISLQI